MNWIERLNSCAGQIDLGADNRAQVLSWHYQPYLGGNQPHRHTYFEICLVGEYGHGAFRIFGDEFVIDSGATFFAPPGEIHQITNIAAPGMELFWISFSLEIGGGEIGALLRAFCQSRVALVHDARIRALWLALREVSGGEWGAATPSQMAALSQSLLLAIVQGGAGHDAPSPVAAPPTLRDRRSVEARVAVQYVHDNLGKRLTLAEIANYLHVSPRHLARLFNEFTGIPVAAYIERARLDRARILLINSDKPLKEVAREVGYEDVAHFNRVFARGVGQPPGAFRKRGNPYGVQHAGKTAGKNLQKSGDFV